MITAHFTQKKGQLTGVVLSGHAEYAALGTDIVCSAVTSAVQLTANAITEILLVDALVIVEENLLSITLPENISPEAVHFLRALHLQLSVLSEDYSNHVSVTLMEVS